MTKSHAQEHEYSVASVIRELDTCASRGHISGFTYRPNAHRDRFVITLTNGDTLRASTRDAWFLVRGLMTVQSRHCRVCGGTIEDICHVCA